MVAIKVDIHVVYNQIVRGPIVKNHNVDRDAYVLNTKLCTYVAGYSERLRVQDAHNKREQNVRDVVINKHN